MRFSAKVRPLLLTAALFFAGMFSGCNVPDTLPTATQTPEQTVTPIPPTVTPTQKPTATATPVPEYLKIDAKELPGTELTLRYSLDGKVRNTLDELINRFNTENPDGITVRTERAYSAEELTELTAADSREKTDLVIADSSWLRNRNADGNMLLELSGFLNDPVLELKGEALDPLMPVMLKTEYLSEKYYALPLWTSPAFLFYNKTWAIELGFPETPADLADFAVQVCAAGKANYAEKDDSKHGTGGWIVSSAPEDVMSWMLTFTRNGETPGDLLRSDDGEVFTEAAIWLRNLFDNGCAWNSRIKEPYDYFANRYALFYSGTYSDAERQLSAFEQSEEHGFDNWDLVVYPVRAAGSEDDPRIFGDVTSIAILQQDDAKKISAAWRFIRWLYRETNAAELALSAGAWPVQDNDEVTKLYRKSGKDKLYQTLSYRQYLVNSDADENWLTDQLILSDGFDYVFNPSAKPEDIPGIWEQIGSIIAEINNIDHLSETALSESTNKTGVNNETQP